ncbi:MAG: aminopeptidase [Spirochaetia bacterium]|jgi:predicted aminopeptidase
MAAVGVLLVSGCASQVGYLAKQGSYLLRYSSGTRPVSSLIEDPSTPADTREFLQKVRDIKSFAVTEVGLKNNDNYTRYKEIDKDHLVDVVQACDAVSFDAYMWSYPFLGKLPYKGFYERADADAEASRLRGLGYDVIVRPVDAFSTLGFTKDPIYSFMKRYPPFEIASLIIHEQTHATLFLKDQPDFNEEMATFVGDEGAFLWLRATYGEGSQEYQTAVDSKADSDLFISLLHDLSGHLRVVYEGASSREKKLARKAQIINEFARQLTDARALGFRTPAYAKLERIPLNNAYLSLYSLYSDDIPLLRAWFEQRCGSSLKRFMESMKEIAAHGDVKAQLRSLL